MSFSAPLTSDEVDRILTAPDRLKREALDAENCAVAEIRAGSPIAAREWLDVALRLRELAASYEPRRLP